MNRVDLIGRVATEPTLRYTVKGTPVTNFILAVPKTYKKNTDGQTNAYFIPVVCWDGTAIACCENLIKGRQIGIDGKVASSSYEKDGQTIYKTYVDAAAVDFLGYRKNMPTKTDAAVAPSLDEMSAEVHNIPDEEIPF